MFNALVEELATQFNLGGHAGALVRTVLTYLFQEEAGGLSGFLDRFRRAGLGNLVSSWMNNAAPRELTVGQLESVLGGGLLAQLADKAGLPVSMAKPALAALLPKLIGMLTPGGRVPTAMPAAVSGWLGGAARPVASYGTESLGEAFREPVATARSMWPWLLPLLGLTALGLLWSLWPTTRGAEPPMRIQTVASAIPSRIASELWPMKIYFATDSKTIGPADSARIQRAADYLRANPTAAVDITGFADKTGGAAGNEELARERAEAVRVALVSAGVAESRANVAQPASVTGGANDAEARRVEIRPRL